MDSLTEAIKGKSANDGGLNIKDFREALIKKFPQDTVLINKFSRKELEVHYKDKIGSQEKKVIGNLLTKKQYVFGNYFSFTYSGKKYNRWVYSVPILVEIKVSTIEVPDFKPGTEIIPNYPGQKEMEEIENKLKYEKSLIDEVIEDSVYSIITDILEYYKHLKNILRNKYHINYVTNAWLKLQEMLHYLNLVKDNSENLYAFHNCELPGAMIQSTIYFMKTWRPKRKYEWRASSLVPREENKTSALDDQYGLWRNNRNNWMMSLTDPKNNGDTTNVSNIHHMVKTLNKKVDFYTSDAGIAVGFGDSSTGLAFNDQEQLNMILNLGQILAMLETLKEGGSFITKQYTFFKPYTYSLMIILASMFDKFYLTKPLTSKPTNSETYLAGIGFKGLSNEWKIYLENTLASYTGVIPMPGPLLPPEVINEHKDALKTIINAAEEIYYIQGELIKNNIEIYKDFKNKPNELLACIINNREKLENEWINDFIKK